jgi:hypothetical protein
MLKVMPKQKIDPILDTIVNAPLKDDRALMEFPSSPCKSSKEWSPSSTMTARRE